MRASIDSVSALFRTWFNGSHVKDKESIMEGDGCGNFVSDRGDFGYLSSQISRVLTTMETSTTYARFVNSDDSRFSLSGNFVCEECKVNWVISESMQCFFSLQGESCVSLAMENKRVCHRACSNRCGPTSTRCDHRQLLRPEVSSCPKFFVVELVKSAGSFAEMGIASNFQLELTLSIGGTLFDLTSISYAKPGHFMCEAVRVVGSGKRLWCSQDDIAKQKCVYLTSFPSSAVYY